MNETDVREEIVRPLLHRLGYSYGGEAYIRTELALTYPSAFLGRKKPDKDPPLRGRADYICGVAMSGRWVVEVKESSNILDSEVIQQAHTYAAHPEVGALFFLITNGTRFKLFQTGQLEEPVLDWTIVEIETRFLNLFNLVGPEAIKKRSRLLVIDPDKPLGKYLPSTLRIMGGSITYGMQRSSHPFLRAERAQDLALPIVGGFVRRTSDGRIHGSMKIAEVMPLEKEMNIAMAASEAYDYYSDSEFLSDDPQLPTLFENISERIIPRGTGMRSTPGIPWDITCKAVTLASGIVVENWFRGVFEITLHYKVCDPLLICTPQFPEAFHSSGIGTFDVEVLSTPRVQT